MTNTTIGVDSEIRVAYVVKRYPRFSETFIVNEVLAHEEAGLPIKIFSLKPSNDTHFQDQISRVRAPVRILPHAGLKATTLWESLCIGQCSLPGLPSGLSDAWSENASHVHQALVLAQTIVDSGISHVHAHFGTSPATVARLAARFADVSYSFTAHAKDLYHENVDRAQLLKRHRDRATIVTVSDFNRRILLDEFGFRPDRVERVYNGLDLDRFRYGAPIMRPRRIVAIGRLIVKKGFDDLIDACGLLRDAGCAFECRIIGMGPEEESLRKRIEERNLVNHVSLLGPLPQHEVCRELEEAAVFAAPCVIGEDGDRDGVPTTLIEAMALGVSCVSTDVTGIPELVRHKQTGLVVPQRDPKALMQAIGRLLDRSGERMDLSLAARQHVEDLFDVRKSTRQLREIFRKAVAEHAGMRGAKGKAA